MLEWSKLLTEKRRTKKGKAAASDAPSPSKTEFRTVIERDHDRVLFSTPVRRLADKTQVFPLERNDSVRTRLTHSHEVSNLARSVGVALVYKTKIFKGIAGANRNVPAMLGAVGLAHDLGNPPYGHQGEKAIGSWFADNQNLLKGLTPAEQQDFLKFEGNAQTLRIATRLQVVNDNRGLNLTLGTLGALMKYTVQSTSTSKKSAASKKFGFFQSEADVVSEIWEATGLGEGVRHPLAYIMEACDDIAYSVLDVEDAVKKGLVSVSDILAWIEHESKQPDVPPQAARTARKVLLRARSDYREFRTENLSPAELNDVSMQKLRVHAIGAMISAVTERFKEVVPSMLACDYGKELIADSRAGHLRDALKAFAYRHAFTHRSVLEVELRGYHIIRGLMNILWDAISAVRENRANPYHRYVYGRISENYRRVAEDSDNKLSPLYRDLQLITDMVSGMTDSFAVSLHKELSEYK